MKIILLLCFLSFSFFFAQNKNFAELDLKPGLPSELADKTNNFSEPLYIQIPTDSLFDKFYFIWDKKEPKSYIFYYIKDNYQTGGGGGFRFYENMYSDSSWLQYPDANQSLVFFELKLDPLSNKLKYYWTNSKENGIFVTGGLPQLIAPVLSLNKTMPDFTVKNTEGKEIKLADFAGKNLFVLIWLPWNRTCQQIIPAVVELKKQISDSLLTVIGLVNFKEEKPEIRVPNTEINFPNYIISQEQLDNWKIHTFPVTLLINREGKIIGKNYWGNDMWQYIFLDVK